MIGSLNGTIAEIEACEALVDVNGVGYDVTIPQRLANRITVGDAVRLYTHMYVSNTGSTQTNLLYGFGDAEDRWVFRRLLGVTKLGPRTAASILSELSAGQIANAIQRQDQGAFTRVQGVGKKMASTIVFELREDVKSWVIEAVEGSNQELPQEAATDSPRFQAIAALRQLGFTRTQAEQAVGQVWEDGVDLNTLTQRSLMIIRQL